VQTKFFGLIGLNSVSIGASKALVNGVKSVTNAPPVVFDGGKFVDVLSNGTVTIGGAQIHGSVRSTHGSVVVQSGSVITGDVTAPTITNSGTIQGTKYFNTTNSIAATVTWQACALDSAATLRNKIPTGAYTYSPSTGDFSVAGGATVNFSGGTVLNPVKYCFHNFTLSGGATVVIGGGVQIYITGVLSATGGSFSNGLNLPADLQIFDSYSGANGVTLSGGTQSYLTLYAPLTDVTLSGGSPLYGAVLGKTIVASGNAQFHIDLNVPPSWAPGLHIVP
jgi:hypothetical protein